MQPVTPTVEGSRQRVQTPTHHQPAAREGQIGGRRVLTRGMEEAIDRKVIWLAVIVGVITGYGFNVANQSSSMTTANITAMVVTGLNMLAVILGASFIKRSFDE